MNLIAQILTAMAAVGLAATSVVASSEGKAKSRPASILVGVSNAQSGPSGILGRQITAGSKAYFDLVNARGGVNGRQIQIVLEDDRYEPDPAVSNTYDLIQRKNVFCLFDFVGTPTLTRVLPLLRYHEAEGILNIAPMTGAEPHRKPPFDQYVISIRASYEQETKVLVDYLVGQGKRKIGMFEQADAYGKSGEIGVQKALDRHDLTIAAIATYSRNSPPGSSMRAQVDLLKRAGVDAVISIGVYDPCAAFIRDARAAGYDGPIAHVSFVNADALGERVQEYSRAAGTDLSRELLSTQVVPPPETSGTKLAAEFRSAVPKSSRGFISFEGWLNAVILAEGLRRTPEPLERWAFRRSMESLGGWDPGLGFGLKLSHTRHTGMDAVWLTRLEHKQWKEISWPARD